MAKIVGEVAIDVTADVGPLIRAGKRGEGALDGMRGASDRASRALGKFGDVTADLGKKMSIVSGAIAAAAGGAFLLAKGTADSAREISTLSKLANTSTTDFQRMASASKTVGIEQDKLADILKDTNDKFGEYAATGGGPLLDFFTNIAPKVGLTADAFANLSGPQALQLYADSLQKAGLSQQQMTFYMEALASDATGLLPLLANNGAEMKRLGDAAQEAGKVMGATAIAKSQEFNTALQNLQERFQGVKDRFAVTLMPVFTELMNTISEKVIPVLSRFVDSLGGWIQMFSDLPGPVKEAAAAIGAALGVGGPVLLAVSVMSTALSALIAATGPVGLLISFAAVAAAAWIKWGDQIKSAVGGAIDFVGGKFQALLGWMQGVIDKAVAVKNAIVEAFTGAEAAKGRAAAMGGSYADPAQGYGIGQNLGAGIVGGLGTSIQDNEAQIRSYIDQVPAIARDQLGIHSPSRVFADIGNFLGLGMAQGISESTGMVAAAAAGMGQVAVDQTQNSVSGVLNSMGQLFQGSKKLSAGIALANSWLAFTEVLKDPSYIGRPFARFAAAASALASGLNAVKNIKAATPGGSGGGAGGATSQTAAVPQQPNIANVTWIGDATTSGFRSLTEKLNAEFKQGYILNIN